MRRAIRTRILLPCFQYSTCFSEPIADRRPANMRQPESKEDKVRAESGRRSRGHLERRRGRSGACAERRMPPDHVQQEAVSDFIEPANVGLMKRADARGPGSGRPY